ncbi:MAG: hypothetical protein JSS60_00715 [Verrucomicrobia bacterium]|nr:hypothetical protein [Verrucomicrobiota bacterium]
MKKSLFLYLTTLPIFCHAQPGELSHSGFFAQGSVLYWQAEEGGLSYAIESSSAQNLSKDADNKKLPFDWDFGFNIGLGYRIPHDTWDLLLQFTNLQTHTDAREKAEKGRVLLPVWETPSLPPLTFAHEATAHWRLHLGLIDFLLGKPFHPTQTLTLTPQIGVRWGSVRQKFNIEYRGGSFLPEEELLIRMKNKFWGLGPYAGMSADYRLAKGFSLFAKTALSLLYGEFYLHQDADNEGTKEKLLGVHDIYRASSAIFEAAAGLRWQKNFSGTLKKLTLELAWDQLLLFSQNQLLRFMDNAQPVRIASNQDDLSIAGVHFNVGFEF